MDEAEALRTEEEGVVTFEEKHLPSAGETCVRVFYTTRGKRDDESVSVTQPLLQHKYQDSNDENHKADTEKATDGADPTTSVPHHLEMAGRHEAGCGGSVRSLCSDRSRHECPICSELLHLRHITLLNCNHTLCHRCIAGIMRRAKDQSRLQCPFCRQNTPFPQWEIRRLQEESYSDSVYGPRQALVVTPGPELQAVPESLLCCFAGEERLEADTHIRGCSIYAGCLVRGFRLVRPYFICFCVTALLLLSLVLLGYFLYMVVPVLILSILFSGG